MGIHLGKIYRIVPTDPSWVFRKSLKNLPPQHLHWAVWSLQNGSRNFMTLLQDAEWSLVASEKWISGSPKLTHQKWYVKNDYTQTHPWEPTTFMFRGYTPIRLGLKTFMVHGKLKKKRQKWRFGRWILFSSGRCLGSILIFRDLLVGGWTNPSRTAMTRRTGQTTRSMMGPSRPNFAHW